MKWLYHLIKAQRVFTTKDAGKARKITISLEITAGRAGYKGNLLDRVGGVVLHNSCYPVNWYYLLKTDSSSEAVDSPRSKGGPYGSVKRYKVEESAGAAVLLAPDVSNLITGELLPVSRWFKNKQSGKEMRSGLA